MAIVGVSTTPSNYEQITYHSNGSLAQARGVALPIIAPGATTKTLTVADSGSICLFDGVAVAYTLPVITAANIGMYFDFKTAVTTTSAHSVTTGAATQYIVGEIAAAHETAGSQDAFAANGTSHVAISTNGSTKGGLIGDAFRLIAITATQWWVEGTIVTSGTAATPFA